MWSKNRARYSRVLRYRKFWLRPLVGLLAVSLDSTSHMVIKVISMHAKVL